jgi:ABC-type proline/glycine betaine transport system permease subunit
MRAVIWEVELRAALNIMLEGMRYWYVHASSLGR